MKSPSLEDECSCVPLQGEVFHRNGLGLHRNMAQLHIQRIVVGLGAGYRLVFRLLLSLVGVGLELPLGKAIDERAKQQENGDSTHGRDLLSKWREGGAALLYRTG